MNNELDKIVMQVKYLLEENNDGNVLEIKAGSKDDADYLKKELKNYSVLGITSISSGEPMKTNYIVRVKKKYGSQKNA